MNCRSLSAVDVMLCPLIRVRGGGVFERKYDSSFLFFQGKQRTIDYFPLFTLKARSYKNVSVFEEKVCPN